MAVAQHCGHPRRRQLVEASDRIVGGTHEINGLDHLEVLDADAPSEAERQLLVDVFFIKPDGVHDLTAAHFVIEGGERVVGIAVEEVTPLADPRGVRLRLDQYGDHSLYTLRVVAGDGTDDPPEHIDLLLAEVTFSFKVDCGDDFDCRRTDDCPPEPPTSPELDYLSRDYASFRRLMLDRLSVTLPAWTERSAADLGVTLVELLAAEADHLSYHQDAVATEAYLSRARRRTSVRRHARLLDYTMHEGCNARSFVALEVSADLTGSAAPVLEAGTRVLTRTGVGGAVLEPDPFRFREALNAGAVVFETMDPVWSLKVARNTIPFHTWGDASCCLRKGATGADLAGAAADLGLARGDVLVLVEEHRADGLDPDLEHRQAVRLSEDPVELLDKLTGEPVLRVTWHAADALAFTLDLSDGDGNPLGNFAHGNVVLADHGRTLDHADPRPEDAEDLTGAGLEPSEVPEGHFTPALTEPGRVTWRVPHDETTARTRAAADALVQSPRGAEPAVTLRATGDTWSARRHLLQSGRFAPEFVVESEDDGSTSLRFGDGTFGKLPSEGTVFTARPRFGNGMAGNVGAKALGQVVTTVTEITGVTNPLPAVGGQDREDGLAVKLDAPQAFRVQKRAVTADDYADAVTEHEEVSRAVATRRWTGSWHTMFITVDRLHGREVDAAFEQTLRDHIESRRLAGHDVEIDGPRFVSLDVALIVCVASGYLAADVEAALHDVFTSGARRDGEPGFFHPDRFSFGQTVYLSPILAAAMEVPGVRWVGTELDGLAELGRFRRWVDPGVDYVEDGEIRLDRLEIARLENDPNVPEHGRLEFIMEGGR